MRATDRSSCWPRRLEAVGESSGALHLELDLQLRLPRKIEPRDGQPHARAARVGTLGLSGGVLLLLVWAAWAAWNREPSTTRRPVWLRPGVNDVRQVEAARPGASRQRWLHPAKPAPLAPKGPVVRPLAPREPRPSRGEKSARSVPTTRTTTRAASLVRGATRTPAATPAASSTPRDPPFVAREVAPYGAGMALFDDIK